jgi:hypothetical protein
LAIKIKAMCGKTKNGRRIIVYATVGLGTFKGKAMERDLTRTQIENSMHIQANFNQITIFV